jgi:phosphatidylinositol alpha-1,6-mannosyltransferase
MALVLAEEAAAGRLEASAAALSDVAPPKDVNLPIFATAGSRIRYAAHLHKAAVRHTHFLYDFVGVSKAHCMLPLLKRPFLTYIHGVEVWEGTRPDRITWAHRATRMLSNTTYTRQRAELAFGGFGNVQTCWLATETDELPKAKYTPDKPPVVMILGRVADEMRKGHEELVECWPKVVAAVPGARLLIGGRGPAMNRLKQRAAASSVASLIEFPGFVPDEQIDSLWSRATVFAMPSRVEGFGIVYIEAMRYGVPVIASVHDAAPEINIDGETGFNVNLDQPGELPQRIIELLSNPALAAKLGAAGQQRWLDHFRYVAWKKRFTPLLWDFLNHT